MSRRWTQSNKEEHNTKNEKKIVGVVVVVVVVWGVGMEIEGSVLWV
jgi:hypothetical protein